MLKKLFFAAILMLGINSFAQEVDFGIQAGYTSLRFSAKNSGITASENYSGFYVGFLTDFHLDENWHIQPSANYMNVNEVSMLTIPVLAQYYIENSSFYVQAGPQATIVLEDMGYNSFGLDAAFGLGYHIDEHFFIDAKYAFELTNRYSGNDFPRDVKARINTFNVGVGYKF